ncbi:MAG TPA: sigma-70 family RNA polymerase sigma factor [Thermomicrobiales bacterium]|jgi:RNA polymerase sigma-70 factor (ECF subfamily)|nr:sigma-70 family RNA polymerase sigma factor [Thermomicrobiales bacterium]
MTDRQWLTERFERDRDHLRAVAYRLLGSRAEAEDAVQETWLRLDRTDTTGVDNLTGWLTTVVGRVSLDMLRSRTVRREQSADQPGADVLADTREPGPEHQVEMADTIGAALLVVLNALSPAERLAFVLHDLFGVPFDEIAVIIDRTPDASRQLASRARRKVRGGGQTGQPDTVQQREIVNAFLRASRAGDFDALLEILDPDIAVRADATAVAYGAEPELHGATAVLRTFLGRAAAARLAFVDGVPQAAWVAGTELRAIISFTVADDRISAIELICDRDRLDQLDVELMPRVLPPRPSVDDIDRT